MAGWPLPGETFGGGAAMDAQRFDDLARGPARRASRRSVLRGAAGGAVAGVLAHSRLQSTLAQVCDAGETACNGTCVDLMTDMNNCGACGEICESGLVEVACVAGECVRISCPAALPTSCSEDITIPIEERCVDLTSDPNNCGGCGNVCDSGECAEGVCVPVSDECEEGEIVCDGTCVASCCDNNNCGGCGIVCTNGETCFEGVCDCPSGNCGTDDGDDDDDGPTTLPSTGSGPATGRDGFTSAAVAAAAALGAAAIHRLVPRTGDE